MTAVLVTTDTLGGVWRYAVELAGAWARWGHDVTLATLGPTPDATQRAELPRAVALVETALPLDWTASGPDALGRTTDALARLARERAVDRVHLHAPALVGEADWPAPVVAVVHSCLRTWWRAIRGATDPMPAELSWRDRAAADGLRRAAALIAPGERFAGEVASAYELPRGAIHAVPNGATPPSRANPVERRAAVLGCGRAWDEGKDVAALDAAAHLLPETVAVRFAGALVGPNGERAPPLGRVEALGPLDQARLSEARNAATVFVSTARYEPFGLAVLEAAQSGLALVLVDLPTLREHWDGAALFAPPNDPAALARLIGDALRHPAPLADRAISRAALFTSERMASATAAVHGF